MDEIMDLDKINSLRLASQDLLSEEYVPGIETDSGMVLNTSFQYFLSFINFSELIYFFSASK